MSVTDGLKRRPRVAIIGGGIFGVTTALVLAPFCAVELFERSGELFQGATWANHGRQHFGFHYPRSPETARQCLASHQDFLEFYGPAETSDFPNYYCVSVENSKVSPRQYLRFCDEQGLRYVEAKPPDGILAEGKVALSLRVEEGVIDYATLREIALNRLQQQSSIQVHTSCKVVAGEITGDAKKELSIESEAEMQREKFDFVINATYAHYNTFCEWFGFQRREFQYNLQELDVIELPQGLRLGMTIMDGPFPSCIPMGRTLYHLLAHVNASQLVRESSRQATPLSERVSIIKSNWTGVLEASAEYLPILRKARHIKSLFVDRVVDAGAAGTDARLTEITNHGDGCFSIFAAKIITCVSTARNLSEMIRTQT